MITKSIQTIRKHYSDRIDSTKPIESKMVGDICIIWVPLKDGNQEIVITKDGYIMYNCWFDPYLE